MRNVSNVVLDDIKEVKHLVNILSEISNLQNDKKGKATIKRIKLILEKYK